MSIHAVLAETRGPAHRMQVHEMIGMQIPARSLKTLASLICLLFGAAGAQPEPWRHPDGTIHYYDAVSKPTGIDWNTARDAALTPGGYLATLTSQAENDFVLGLVDSSLYWYERPGSGTLAGPWLGGYQQPGSPEPDSGWQWVSGEPFDFRNWSPGEPDNAGDENALHFGESVSAPVPTWDDLSSPDNSIRGFVRELSADSTTIGLLYNDSAASGGYALFAPLMSRFTYLVDNKGRLVHSWWSSYRPGMSAYLLENSRLLRTAFVGNTHFLGGSGGRVEEFDWDGDLAWFYEYSTTLHCQHHDIEPMPNGNVLLVAWELKTRAEAVAAGRNPDLILRGELWPDHVVEANPANDSIVWEWHIWDHLIQDFDSTKANYGVVADHPELVDINFLPPDQPLGSADWNHTNSVDYNEQFDQIMLSSRNSSEIWIIDHSTTTEEARGHTSGRQGMGGDVLYRWGNPRVYRAGDSTDQRFFGQHDARWIEPGLPGAGHIMVFNNGLRRPDGDYSTIDEFIPACDSTGVYPRPSSGTPFGPAAQSWTYRASPPRSFFSGTMSGAHRLPNGNTFISSEDGTLTEVTPDADVVWRYVNPVIESGPLYQGDTTGGRNVLFRAARFQPDYPGLAGRDLIPGYPLERYRPLMGGVAEQHVKLNASRLTLEASPNPFRTKAAISFQLADDGPAELRILDVTGRLIRPLSSPQSPVSDHCIFSWDGTDNSGKTVGCGVYVCQLRSAGCTASRRLVKLE
jgi:hypothetical protein